MKRHNAILRLFTQQAKCLWYYVCLNETSISTPNFLQPCCNFAFICEQIVGLNIGVMIDLPDLILDPHLKYWVLLPISFVMVVVGLLRGNITFLMQPSPKLPEYKVVKQGQFLQRAQAFRKNNSILTKEQLETRQAFYVDQLSGTEYLAKQAGVDDDPMAQLADPATNEAMMNMLKGNLFNYIPQTIIMGWVNFFFAGFVVMKLPFPLTEGFKGMLQQGVQTPNLDARYVSSISWYFVNLFGLRPIYALLMGDSSKANELVGAMTQQLLSMPNLSGPGTNVQRMFQGEAESIQMIAHTSVFDGIVDRVCQL